VPYYAVVVDDVDVLDDVDDEVDVEVLVLVEVVLVIVLPSCSYPLTFSSPPVLL
jgi:hypothetical protein